MVAYGGGGEVEIAYAEKVTHVKYVTGSLQCEKETEIVIDV